MSTQQPEGHQTPVILPPEIENAPGIAAPPIMTGMIEHVPLVAIDVCHGEFATFHEEYLRHYIQLADTKAGVGFALLTGVLAYTLSRDTVRDTLIYPAFSFDFGLAVSATLLLIASAMCSFLVIAPRLRSSAGDAGLVFFGDVARRASAKEYVSDVALLSEADLTTARLQHCYDVARVCTQKYALLKKSIWLALPALAVAMMTFLAC